MKEPQPKFVLPPQSGEPELGVGIVLKEDEKDVLQFWVDDAGYQLRSSGVSIDLVAGKKYLLRNTDGELCFEKPQSDCLELGLSVELVPVSAGELVPHGGISVSNVIAGRGFHWQSAQTETFPGGLEVFADGKWIVLVNKVRFEDYLACVSSSEMSGETPIEFAKAQIVAARSWALAFLGHKHENTPYSICNDDDCQRYRGSSDLTQGAIDAMRACRGEFLVRDDGRVCPAYYSKSCGGITEEPERVFGFAVPGISAVEDSCSGSSVPDLSNSVLFEKWYEEEKIGNVFCSESVVSKELLGKYLSKVDVGGDYYRWRHRISGDELLENLRKKFGLSDVSKLVDFEINSRGVSGRVLRVTVSYLTESGERKQFELPDQYEIRKALHQSFLFSSAFLAEVRRSAEGIEEICLSGAGWGHGVGLCQIGALGMALEGYDYMQILEHYFPESHIIKSYE